MVTNGTGRPPWSICRGRRIIPACAEGTTPQATCAHQVGGSSPHTRGALRLHPKAESTLRDHPRIRGEHRDVTVQRVLAARIIPAYAGSTSTTIAPLGHCPGSSPHTRGAPPTPRQPLRRSWDHPRIRGEHSDARPVSRRHSGIIPAYAGSTSCPLSRYRSTLGSSPHTRGAQARR